MIVEGIKIIEKEIAGRKYPFFMGMLTLIELMDETGLSKTEVIQKISGIEKHIEKNMVSGIRFFVDLVWCSHLAAVKLMDKEPMFKKNTVYAFLEVVSPAEMMGIFSDGIEENPKTPQAR